jgi:site-specific recombinase XerD
MRFDDAVAQFAAYLLTAGGRARATVDAYGRDLEQFAELSGVGDTAALDKLAVLRWLNKLAELELAGRSRSRKLSALRSFCTWAREYGLLDADPVPREISAPRALYLPHALTEAEVLAIINAATPPEGVQDPAWLRDRAIMETLYASGMRVSELCGLELLDLHPAEGFALVTGKGSKQRLVPLGQYALEALAAYLELGRGVLCERAGMHAEVFLTRRGPVSRSQVFRLVQKYAQLAGVTAHVSPHTFRHSCASHMLAHGADLRLVQELLGHANLATTEIYTHIEKSRLRQVYDATHPLA